jgi:hypothetical protein
MINRPGDGQRHRVFVLWGSVIQLAALCLAGAALAGSAHAMSLRELRALELSDKKHGPAFVQYYLVGVLEGSQEANAQAVRAGAKPLFCVNGRRLEPRMAKPLFDGELQRNKGLYEADMPVQVVMANALATAYSC